ncbi:MAG: three-Cys-motif partner protein TcmP [Desulfurobacteriaceae bacterium]
MDKRNQIHFTYKKLHTEIKHKLLRASLESSLGIASALANTYSYLDLFAGAGIFKEGGGIGSPVIAYETFKKHYEKDIPNHNVETFWMHLCEKDESTYRELNRNIKKLGIKESPFIKGFIRRDWEDEIQTIKKVISKAPYGFFFVDQFSTELDLLKFLPLLEGNPYEVLVFFNQNTLSRQKGRLHENDIKRISKVLGVPEKKVRDIPDPEFKDFVISTLQKHFSNFRNYVAIAAIPITREGSIVDMDYFYLLFATGHPIIMDSFLSTYNEIIIKRRKEVSPMHAKLKGTLFNPSPTYNIEEDLISFLRGKKSCTLNEVFQFLSQEFLSWKAYVRSNYSVPTLRNITYALRQLEKRSIVNLSGHEKFVYKRGPRNKLGEKGQINPDYLKSYKQLQEIKVTYCSRL